MSKATDALRPNRFVVRFSSCKTRIEIDGLGPYDQLNRSDAFNLAAWILAIGEALPKEAGDPEFDDVIDAIRSLVDFYGE